MSYIAPANLAERPIAVLGGGTLGRHIALLLATRGAEVRIYDLSAAQRDAAVAHVAAELPKLLAKNADFTAGHAVGVDDLAKALADTWLIVEAIPERLDLKRAIFGQLDRLAPADAILASNSSSYPSSEFIDEVSEAGRARVANTHFSLPPVPAVEVMSCGHTDPAVMDTLLHTLGTYGGLVPFHVLKESVGFMFNRVWAAIKRESLAIVAEGVSTPEEMDRIFRVNTGSPAGPFRQMDLVGLDVVLDIENNYAARNPALPAGPRELLHQYVDQGWLGVKSGRGFYNDYPAVK